MDTLAHNTSSLEQQKWDEIYAKMEVIDAGPAEQSFHDELGQAVDALLPKGSSILESGCGGGGQGIALARLGGHQVTLLDFAANALSYAKRQAAQAGVDVAVELGDAFAQGKPQYDMVFNAGVLEHYEPASQVEMLRAMASRSKRFVMVLIPNALCFPYWVWRQQQSSTG